MSLEKISSSFVVGVIFLSFGVICICMAAREVVAYQIHFGVCVATRGGRSTRNERASVAPSRVLSF